MLVGILLSAINAQNVVEPTYFDRPPREDKILIASCGDFELELRVENNFEERWDWQSNVLAVRFNNRFLAESEFEELNERIQEFSEILSMSVLCEREAKTMRVDFSGKLRKQKTGSLRRKIEDCQHRDGVWDNTATGYFNIYDDNIVFGRTIGPSCLVSNATKITGKNNGYE